MGFIAKKSDRFPQRYTLSVVYPANQVDAHGDTMTQDELEKAAWRFMSKDSVSRRVGLMHKDGTTGAGTVVESFIYRGDPWTVKDLGGTKQTVNSGDWLMGIVWDPDVFAAIESGEITGLSLQGLAARSEEKKIMAKEKRVPQGTFKSLADVLIGPATRSFSPQENGDEREASYARLILDDPESVAAVEDMGRRVSSWTSNVREFVLGPNSDYRPAVPADRRRGVAKSVSETTIRAAFSAKAPQGTAYVREVLVDPMAVIVEEKGQCFMVPYAVDKSGQVTFDLESAQRVQQDWGVIKKAGVTFENVVFGG